MSHSAKNKPSRYSRYSRFSRYSRVSFRGDEDLCVRKSLAEYVREELEALNRALFYQRVFILAKNGRNPNMKHRLTSITRKSSIFGLSDYLKNFPNDFSERLIKVLEYCAKQTFTIDKIVGVCLYMGEYTLIIVEGNEDMVEYFCTELSNGIGRYWMTNRVFLVEDKIDNLYFTKFYCRRAMPVNINEQFQASASNDEHFMGRQHWHLKEKLRNLCEELKNNLLDSSEIDLDEPLSSDYVKLLPEVQRIELILNSSRFYQEVEMFCKTYRHIPLQYDEDVFIWPVPYGYTPMGVFQRSPYDVNLTFPDYKIVNREKAKGKNTGEHEDDPNKQEETNTSEH